MLTTLRGALTAQKRHLFVLLSVFLTASTWTLAEVAPAASKKTETIKLAVVTPEGSTWTNLLHGMRKELAEKSDGEIDIKIYAGGISGDELDVLRKLRSNQLHAAGLSGVGLGVLVPEVRILEAPLLFRDGKEVDLVKEKLFDEFAAAFGKKGFVLLGFAEAGFVNVFSQVKIDNEAALRQMKMWVWKGDSVAESFLNEFKIRTTPLHLADVNTGLETGMIDSFYSPPLAAVAFQWAAKAKYMLEFPFVNSTGAILVSKRSFAALSPKSQALLRDVARKTCNEIVLATRKENSEALEVIKKSGVHFTTPSTADVAQFHKYADAVYKKSIGEIYSKELFERVSKILQEARAAK